VQVKTKNLLVGALVAVLVMALWYKMMYSPAQSSATKAKGQAEAAEQQADVLRTQVASETAKRKEKAAAVPHEKLQAALPLDDQVTTFIRKSNDVATSSGVAWQSVTPSVPTVVGTTQSINVAISVEGGYAQVMSYLRGMLGADRILLIDNVALTAGASKNGTTGGGPTGEVFAGQGGAPVLQAQISGRLFYQADASALAAGKAGSGSTKTAKKAAAKP
jgi:Tfp pilus assembly protein PilO